MSAFWIGMGSLILLVIVLVAIPVVSAILPTLRGAPTTQPGTQGGVAGAQPLYKNPFLWVGVAGVTILWFTVDRNLLLGVGILAVMATLAVKGKGGMWAKMGVAVLAVSLFFLGERAPEGLQKVQGWASGVALDGKPILPEDSRPPQVLQPPVAQAERSVRPSDGVIAHATWKGSHADGPPVGVESDVQEIPFGCGVNFSHGNGVTYKVRYCFRSCQSEKNWQDHQPGTFPPMSHLKFTVLEEGRGMTKVPFAWNCPGR